MAIVRRGLPYRGRRMHCIWKKIAIFDQSLQCNTQTCNVADIRTDRRTPRRGTDYACIAWLGKKSPAIWQMAGNNSLVAIYLSLSLLAPRKSNQCTTWTATERVYCRATLCIARPMLSCCVRTDYRVRLSKYLFVKNYQKTRLHERLCHCRSTLTHNKLGQLVWSLRVVQGQ